MKRSLVVASVVWMAVAVFGARLAAQTAVSAPSTESAQIAKGRLVVAQACTTCHTTLGRMLQVHKQTAAQWKDTLYFMISRGAQVMPDEIEPVAAFLAETSGRDPVVSGVADAQGRRGGGRGQDQGPPPPKDVVAPAIPGVVAAGTHIELVAFPVQGTEGPIGLPDGSGIIFTERNIAHITKVDLSGNRTPFVESAEGANGLGWDSKGRLIAVLRPPSGEKVGVLYPPASVATLADNAEGKPFNGLNDLVVSKKDGIYFTDTQGVYFLPPGGPVKKVQDIKNANGVQLSPDERTLYANNKDGEYLLAFDVRPDGSLTNRRNFGKYKSVTIPGHADPRLAEDNGADGLAIDNEGRLYTATNVGIEVFSPRGQHLGVIPMGIWGGEQNMLRKPQNLAFGGPDRKTLYTVGSNAICRVQLLAQGVKGRGK